MRDQFIRLPPDMDSLQGVLDMYTRVGLPGCGDSIDVVHCKWSTCPAGDRIKAKGKEKFPTLAFECISDNRRRVLGVAPVQFGSRNDQHIVRMDPYVKQLRKEWYKDVDWSYFDVAGNERWSTGVYLLICDGGYLRWKSQGYFSANLERILEYGFQYCSAERNEMIFVVCCILHNIMIDLESNPTANDDDTPRVGRGMPLPGDAIYIAGPGNATETWSEKFTRAEQII
eukprot:scaffold83045_cov25-Cyclotella_meneghiniana.AAC.3